jgi:phosphoglycolate phosphatase-like HAD superfamily hydrolase
MNTKKLIVFDMDGVIIDVSQSYRDTIRQSARLFFKGAQSWEDLPDPLFSLSDLATVKQSGGLNNDWDLTCFVIRLLSFYVDVAKPYEDKDPWGRFKKTTRHYDVSKLARYLKSTNRPLTGLLDKKNQRDDSFILSLYSGDVGSGNIIKQIFQEIYLGPDLFESTYGMTPLVYFGDGLIKNEKLLIEKSILKRLSTKNTLAIATGRPKAEAEYPIDLFGLKSFFKDLYALDDCIQAEKRILQSEGKKVSLSKPNPYMLDAIADSNPHTASALYYIGDMPDDMVAAARSRAGYKGIGVLWSAPDKKALKKELLRAGADYIIEKIEELTDILESDDRLKLNE